MLALSVPLGIRIIATYNHGDDRRPLPLRLPLRRAWTLFAVREGRVRLPDGGHAVAGDVLLLHPGRRLALALPPGARARSATFTVVHVPLRPAVYGFHPAPGAPRQPDPLALWGVDLPLRVPPAWCPGAVRTLDDLVDRWWLRGPGAVYGELCLMRWLSEMVLAALRGDAQAPDADAAWLARVEAHARATFRSGCRVTDLALVAGMSRSRLQERWRAARGYGPGEFLRRLRLEEARAQLANGTLGIAGVAHRSGYRGPAALRRAFRRAEGESPAAWRRRHK